MYLINQTSDFFLCFFRLSGPIFCQRVVLQFAFCGFWKCPHFSGPAPIFFKYDRNWFDFLPPACQKAEGGGVRTQPTAGGLHAWVATGPQFGLQHQLPFSHLKAVYEQILEGHQWVETGINQHTHSPTT